MKKSKRKRVYRLDDLAEIANQLGGRLQLQIIPAEMCRPMPPPTPDKPKPQK